jgi:hypothetical protein
MLPVIHETGCDLHVYNSCTERSKLRVGKSELGMMLYMEEMCRELRALVHAKS